MSDKQQGQSVVVGEGSYEERLASVTVDINELAKTYGISPMALALALSGWGERVSVKN